MELMYFIKTCYKQYFDWNVTFRLKDCQKSMLPFFNKSMMPNANVTINFDQRIKLFFKKKKEIQLYQMKDHIKTTKNHLKTVV